MALSGSLTTSGGFEGRNYTLSWTATQSVANNTSTISWKLSAVGGTDGWYAERDLIVKIDGQTVYSKTARVERAAGQITSGTLTLTHGSDGARSFSASVSAAVYYATINSTGSATFTLDNIARKATITSAPNFTDEDSPTITYSNSAGSAASALEACISLAGSTDDIAYRAISKTGSSYTFSLTTAERNVLRNATTNAKSRSVFFYVKTVIDGQTHYSKIEKTLTITNAAPTLSPTVVDSNSTTVALTGSNARFIRGFSDARFTVGATAQKGATIQSVKVSCGAKASSATSGTLSDVESATFLFRAIDSRGFITNATLTKTLVNYIDLTCNLRIGNPDAEGDLTFTISGDYFNGSFGKTANTLTVQYRRSTDGGSTWTSWTNATATKSGNTYTATVSLTGLDYQTAYTFEARATDKLQTATSAGRAVKTIPVFDWGENDFSFNVPVDVQGTLNVEGAVYLSNSTAVYGANADGTARNLVHINQSNWSNFGYGGYAASEGATGLYGNEVNITSRAGTYIDGLRFGANKVLWSGAWYMNASQSAPLSEAVSAQAHGIVLAWSAYADGTAQNYDWRYQFVPKHHVTAHGGAGVTTIMATATFGRVGSKYVYVGNTAIDGNANNNQTGTASGITYNNAHWVLRYVIGV